jgi:N-acyl-D-amino-acid deacylase
VTTRTLSLALAALLALAACPSHQGGGGPPDSGAPDSGSPDGGADPAACEASLAAQWASSPPSTGMASPSSAASYDRVIGKLMADYGVPGGAVAVALNGKLVFAKGYGWADPSARQPAHADQLFRVASVSKQITSAEVLRLVDAGKLGLDEKAFDILSDLQPVPGATRNAALSAITVRHLLTHTGGWNRDSTFDPMFNSQATAAALSEPGPASCTDVIRYMLDKPLQYTPGTTYCYSNFGYCVLGRIIERRSGQTYSDRVRSDILVPSGASDMQIGKSLLTGRADNEVAYVDYPGAGLANSVFPNSTAQVPWPYGGFYLEAMDSHGAWIASPVDLLRFQVGIDGRRGTSLLSSQSLSAMVANPSGVAQGCNADGSTSALNSNYWYGFGWEVNSSGNWWHNGSLPGTYTEVVRASNGYGWAAFFNTRPRNDGAFGSRLDNDLWTALNGSGAFLQQDLFDQFGTFTDWLFVSDFADRVNTEQINGRYPVRSEGRLNNGVVQYRAVFVPIDSAQVNYALGLECPAYVARDAELTGQGFGRVSLHWFRDWVGRARYQATWGKYR